MFLATTLTPSVGHSRRLRIRRSRPGHFRSRLLPRVKFSDPGPVREPSLAAIARPLPARQHKFVLVCILEDCRCSPRLLLRFHLELSSFRFHHFCRRKYVIAPKRQRLKLSDTALVPFRSEQRQPRVCPGNHQFDPSLLLAHRLVRSHFESQLLRKKLQSGILIAHFQHLPPFLERSPIIRQTFP